MQLATAVRESKTYRALHTLYGWAANSATAGVVGDERVLAAAAGGVVLLSVAAVLASNLGAGVKFLSFLAVFAAVGGWTKRRLDPPAE